MKFGMRFGDPFGNVEATAFFAKVDPFNVNRRVLSWTPERTTGVLYHIIMDAVKKYVVDEGIFEQTISHLDINPRAVIEVIETSTQNFDEPLLNVMTLPDDRILLTWSPVTGASRYRVFRKLAAGSYGDFIFEVEEGAASFSFTDGPLEDADYVYKLEAADPAGNLTIDEEPVTITSAPGRPSNLVASWDSGTSILTLSWTASPSTDLDHYAIRHNGGSGFIRLDDAVEDTEATTSWTIDLTAATGDYEFLVRSVDTSGVEEQNISQMIRFSVVAGVHPGLPSVPQNVQVAPIPGGKARLTFVYFPAFEEGFNPIGIAFEARIYYDSGTGTVDFVTPLGVLPMGNPVTSQVFTFDSGVLADDTYLFAVRVATAGAGAGAETQNDDTHEVTTDGIAPGAVDLAVEVF